MLEKQGESRYDILRKDNKRLYPIGGIDLSQANVCFADQVKYLRFKLKISQAALAKELGVSVPTVSRWERGSQEPHIMALGSFYDFCKKHEISFEEVDLKCLEKH